MKNSVEKASIARATANYIIDHLLHFEQPMNGQELEVLAKDIVSDRAIDSNSDELKEIAKIVITYVRTDPKVHVQKGKDDGLLWVYHKGK